MSKVSSGPSETEIEAFVCYWSGREGGQERANFPRFLIELCDILGVDRPEAADATHKHNDYVFERRVERTRADGTKESRRIDLYRRDCFIMEAKQSRLKGPKRVVRGQGDFFAGDGQGEADVSGFPPNWDTLMINARRQAQGYARALPPDHAYPPFILTCDVGRTIEVFADFSRTGRHYSHFPDAQSFQISLSALKEPSIRERLRCIWEQPHALDPANQTAKVTREIAGRLADISRALESRGIDPGQAALLLMRCLFTMFVEDVGLLKEGAFTDLLERCAKHPSRFPREMEDLWRRMDKGEYSPAIGEHLLRFNGKLFKEASALPLTKNEILLLKGAAEADWRDLEPAIFGSLFERALDPEERRKLGAHYTPRAYVERLVNATIMELLDDDWTSAESNAERALADGSTTEAIKCIEDFLKDLTKVRVLDPACGTGNFLYVALKQMKELEGKALAALHDLGGEDALRRVENVSVRPDQFFGIEVNSRAVEISELVLWVGYIQWHLRTRGKPPIEPILDDKDHVVHKDALLTWADWPLLPMVRGKEVYDSAKKPDWPEADFIVGNPPFIGKGRAMRSALGDKYVGALWNSYKKVDRSSDYVMYWWERSADIITQKDNRLRRFGFVTTNSITQIFNRRVVEKYIKSSAPLSIVMAIPDHPWTKMSKEAAAVRIAMTVAEAGVRRGVLQRVIAESDLDSDEPKIDFDDFEGHINADLSIGADVAGALSLKANDAIACNGMMLAGQGFVVGATKAAGFISQDGLLARKVVKQFIKGGELLRKRQDNFVIDFFGLSEREARSKSPSAFQHVLETVKPDREKNRRRAFQKRWWIFGEPRRTFRPALKGLTRYLATTETAKHRIFQFIDEAIVPDHMVIAIALDDAYYLGVLSSRLHVAWSLRTGGWLGVGNDPRYSKSRCFDPFPFPDTTESVKDEIRGLAEELDATRKTVLAEHGDLTLTGLYNVLEKIKSGLKLTEKDESTKSRGRVLILKDLHEQIDLAVFKAYGWSTDLSDEEILERVVALNAERAAEERRGFIKWLRPDYQIEKFGPLAHKADKIQSISVSKKRSTKTAFPKDHKHQTAEVISLLRSTDVPLAASTIAARYKNSDKTEADVRDILSALERIGAVQSYDGGRSFVSSG